MEPIYLALFCCFNQGLSTKPHERAGKKLGLATGKAQLRFFYKRDGSSWPGGLVDLHKEAGAETSRPRFRCFKVFPS